MAVVGTRIGNSAQLRISISVAHSSGAGSPRWRASNQPCNDLDAVAAHAAGFSITAARPWPTPMHIVASP